MIKKIKAIYIDEDGKKTEECIVLEILVNNKGTPDFKTKSEVFGYMKMTDEDSGELGMYPFAAVYTNDFLLLDFGDTYSEYSKELLETPTKPRFGRYLHVVTKGLEPVVGKQIIIAFNGDKIPYQITRIEDYK